MISDSSDFKFNEMVALLFGVYVGRTAYFVVLRPMTSMIIRRNVQDEKRSYNLRKTFTYVYSGLFLFRWVRSG